MSSPVSLERDPNAGAAWQGDRLRQEVLFLRSGTADIFCCLFAATSPNGLPGMIVCPPWGYETFELRSDCYALARRLASRGGAAIVLDWVGHGDSTGEPEEATMQRMVAIARDVYAHTVDRQPQFAWGYAGLRLGAAVAALAAVESTASDLLLIQPAFDPAEHFQYIERLARRGSLGTWDPTLRWALGFALPDLTTWDAPDPVGALASFGRPAVCARFDGATTEELPTNVESLIVDGSGRKDVTRLARLALVPLVDAVIDWLAARHEVRQA